MIDALRSRSRQIGVVWPPAIVGVALALVDLTGRSIWLDESATISIASQHGDALWRALERDGGNMSGFYLVCHVLIGWFGDSTLVVRLPSALALGATAALTAHLGARLFDRRTGLVAGFFSAVSLPLVFWGQDARAYAPMTAFVAASYAALLAWCEPRRASGRGAVVIWVCASAAALYCSYLAGLALAAQLVVLACYRGVGRRFVAGALAIACLSVPLALMALGRGSSQLDWLGKPNATTYRELATTLASAGFPPNFAAGTLATVIEVLTGLLALLGAGKALARILRNGPRDERAVVLVVAWIVVPVALAAIESAVIQPVLAPRNLLEVIPAASIGIAALLSRTRLGLVCALVLLGLRLAVVVPTYGISPEPWDAASQVVAGERASDACIAFYPEDGRMALGYYIGTTRADALAAPRPVLPSTPFTEVRPFVERYVAPTGDQLDAIRARCPVLFLVASHDGSAHGTASARAHAAESNALQAALRSRYPDVVRHTLGYAAPILVARYSRPHT